MTDEVIEIPRCCSSRIQSEVACRAALRPFTVPAIWDGASEQQQLLRQCGLASVRMADDGERASALDFIRDFVNRHQLNSRHMALTEVHNSSKRWISRPRKTAG